MRMLKEACLAIKLLPSFKESWSTVRKINCPKGLAAFSV